MSVKMNVDYKRTLIHVQPILDCMVPYLIYADEAASDPA